MEKQCDMPDHRFAIYVRSSGDAGEQTVDVDGQIAAARVHGEACGLRLNFQGIFIDIGSAASQVRPGLGALLLSAHNVPPPFSTIVVESYDRLYRDDILLKALMEHLETLGISILSRNEFAVKSKDMNATLEEMRNTFAEFEPNSLEIK